MTKKLWGGRFSKKTNPLVEEFTKSIEYDYKLATWDLLGSKLHVSMLRKSKFLSKLEEKKIQSALDSILKNVQKGRFKFDKHCEDIHTNIQNAIYKKVGILALKLHTARSRNDQVVFATKAYSKEKILGIERDLLLLSGSLIDLAIENIKIIIPGFTHMQHAQPVFLVDYLSAYIDMFDRDKERLNNIFKNIEIFMGAGALAGTPVEAKEYSYITKEIFAKSKYKKLAELLNIKATENSLDSVSDRDFVIEIINALSIIAMHLSRLAEDFIIWSSKEFGFIDIDESFCTGSSLMPQKKNPDVLELIRGYSGRIYGNLISVLTMMKGLPLAYNRDMQLDKEPLFNSFEIVSSELKVLRGLIKTLKFNEGKIKEQLNDESLYATDLVYYLVNKGIAFKEAHTIIGKLIKDSIDRPGGIKGVTEKELKEYSDKFVKEDIVKLFDPEISVHSKKSIKRKNLKRILMRIKQ